MPIEITDTDGGRGNIIKASQTITESDLLCAVTTHLKQPPEKFKKYLYSLIDLKEVTKLDISVKTVRQISLMCKAQAQNNPDAIVAIIAEQDVTFGLARMWQMLSNSTLWEMQVVRNMETANKWVLKRSEEKWGKILLTFS